MSNNVGSHAQDTIPRLVLVLVPGSRTSTRARICPPKGSLDQHQWAVSTLSSNQQAQGAGAAVAEQLSRGSDRIRYSYYFCVCSCAAAAVTIVANMLPTMLADDAANKWLLYHQLLLLH